MRWREAYSFCSTVVRVVMAGILPGCSSAHTTMYPENSEANNNPGITPAMNRCAMETLADTP